MSTSPGAIAAAPPEPPSGSASGDEATARTAEGVGGAILVFPGQTSRRRDMWRWPLEAIPQRARDLIEHASELLGQDLGHHYRADNEAMFATNRDVQVGVFLANHLHLLLLEEAGVRSSRSLGLSLGEYNHLVHIGALAFDDALTLVAARGAVYDAGPAGAMAAVFPLDLATLAGVVEQARAHGVVEIALLNSPTQHVIAGDHAAVDAALAMLEQEHFVQGRIIEPRIPMHASSFEPAARALRRHLERAPWRVPHAAYVPNATAQPIDQAGPSDFIELLTRHAHEPVRWQASVARVLAEEPRGFFVEVGPGSALTELGRRWQPAFGLHTSTEAAWASALRRLRGGDQHAS